MVSFFNLDNPNTPTIINNINCNFFPPPLQSTTNHQNLQNSTTRIIKPSNYNPNTYSTSSVQVQNFNGEWNLKIGRFNLADYKIVDELDNNVFGKQYFVIDKSTGLKYTMIKIILANNIETEKMFSFYEMVNKYSHELLQNILAINIAGLDNGSFCLSLLTNNYGYDLETHIMYMKEKQSYYTENDLLVFLKQMLSSLMFLMSKGFSHGHINPKSILINATDNDFNTKLDIPFLNDPLKWTFNFPNLVKEHLKRNELFLSPLLNSILTRSLYTKSHDPIKSDIFSLGLCMLYASSLTTKAFYELKTAYDQFWVYKIVSKYLKLRYSTKFIEMISGMLIMEEKKRWHYKKILEYIEEILKDKEK